MRFPAFQPLEPKGILEEKLYQGLNRENLPRITAALMIEKGAARDLLRRPLLLAGAGLSGVLACLAANRLGHRPGLAFWLIPSLAALWYGYSALFIWIGTRRVRHLNVSMEELLRMALLEKERGVDFRVFRDRWLGDYHPRRIKEGLAGATPAGPSGSSGPQDG